MQSKPQYHRWTFTDELILLQNWNGANSIPTIAKLLQVSETRIKEKANILRLEDRGNHAKWTDTEIEFLENIAETDTLENIVRRYNMRVKQEKKLNWRLRTKKSIKKKLLELGYSAKPLVGHVNLTELARYFGRTYRYMQKLVEKEKLAVTQVSSNYIYVKEKDVIEFAKKYPLDVGERMTQEGMIWFLQILGNEE